MGWLKQRKNGQYHARFYQNGVIVQQRLKTANLELAKKRLAKIERDIERGENILASQTRLYQLCDLFLQDYARQGLKTVGRAERYVELLKEDLGNIKISGLTTTRLNRYRQTRRDEGAEDSTVNRELSALRRMMKLGSQHEPPLVNRIPRFPMVNEDNRVRQGFFELDEFEALRGALPDHMKIVISIGFCTGMRLSKILALRWDQIDWDEGMLRLDPGSRIKGVGKVPIIPELHEVLDRWKTVTLLAYPGCKYVCHYNGKKITRIYTSWRSACKRVGLEGKLFHDLRRSALRYLVRAGVPQSVAMMISGHKTAGVFKRYDIVDEKDLKQAASQLSAHLKVVRESQAVNAQGG